VCAVVAGAVVALIESRYAAPINVTVTSDKIKGYTLFAPTVDDIGWDLETSNSVYLIDADGELAHSWRILGSVQLVKLKPDGNLVYSTRDRSFVPRAGVREVDPYGNVVWYYSCRADHDFSCMENGNVMIHYIEPVENTAVADGLVICSRIVEVTPDGDVVWSWRQEDHLGELTELLGITFPVETDELRVVDDAFDWTHNNSCHVIEQNDASVVDARFREGNIFFSYRNLNTIGVIDRQTGEIVWVWGPGELDGQHNPVMTRDGKIVIFDNGTERGYSRVIELDPLSGRIVWEYNDKDARRSRFYSRHISGSQPLPDGNVMICQGNYTRTGFLNNAYGLLRGRIVRGNTSRLFEVNRAKEIVWEAIVHFDGEDVHRVYQATRYSAAYVSPLLRIRDEVSNENNLRRLKSLPYAR
jgi:hypothetical protein